MRNSTNKFKKIYHQPTNHIRHSTPLKNNIYTDPCRDTKAMLKTETSLKNIRISQSRAADYPTSPRRTLQQRLQFTDRLANQPQARISLSQEMSEQSLAGQLLKIDDQCSNKTISDLKWRPAKGSTLLQRQSKLFIQNLSTNELFYCCKCYQYVFEVQKRRHFPHCKDQLFFLHCQRQTILEMCWQRLQRIKQLSSYSDTKQREIADLMDQVKSHQFHRILLINYPKDSRYFTLPQIQQAFVYTYENLLKGRIFIAKPDFFNICQ